MFTSKVTIKSNVHLPKLRTTVTKTVVSRNSNGTVTYQLSSQNESDLIAANTLLAKYEFKDTITVSRDEYTKTVAKLATTTKQLNDANRTLTFANKVIKDGTAIIHDLRSMLFAAS